MIERVQLQRQSGLVDAICTGFPLYAFVKGTRTSQKISKISGSMARSKYKVVLNNAEDRCWPRPTLESNLSGRFEGPMKKDPAAKNKPKHMRQRCRAMRFAPKTPSPDQHANVSRGSKQTHRTHEKGHSDRNSVM